MYNHSVALFFVTVERCNAVKVQEALSASFKLAPFLLAELRWKVVPPAALPCCRCLASTFNLTLFFLFWSLQYPMLSVCRCLCGVVSGRCRGIMQAVIRHPRCSAPLLCVLSAFREPAPMFVCWPRAHRVNWREAQGRTQRGNKQEGRWAAEVVRREKTSAVLAFIRDQCKE